jgi:hypothetical protein
MYYYKGIKKKIQDCLTPLFPARTHTAGETAMPPGGGGVVVWGETLVCVYRCEDGGGDKEERFELVKVCLAPLLIGTVPSSASSVEEIGGVGGSRGAYRAALLAAPFCYVIRGGGEGRVVVTMYSMRPDGSLLGAYVPTDDPGFAAVLGLPWARIAGSDELCQGRPGTFWGCAPRHTVGYIFGGVCRR